METSFSLRNSVLTVDFEAFRIPHLALKRTIRTSDEEWLREWGDNGTERVAIEQKFKNRYLTD